MKISTSVNKKEGIEFDLLHDDLFGNIISTNSQRKFQMIALIQIINSFRRLRMYTKNTQDRGWFRVFQGASQKNRPLPCVMKHVCKKRENGLLVCLFIPLGMRQI